MRLGLIFLLLGWASIIAAQSVQFPSGHPAHHIFDRLDIKYDWNHNIHSSVKHFDRKRVTELGVDLSYFNDHLKHDLPLEQNKLSLSAWNVNENTIRVYHNDKLLVIGEDYIVDQGLGSLEILNESVSDGRGKLFIYHHDDSLFSNYISPSDLKDIQYLKNDSQEWVAEEEVSWKQKKGFFRHFYKTKANFLQFHTPDMDIFVNPIINFRIGKEEDTEGPVFQNTRGLEIRALIDKKVYIYSSIFENQAKFYNYIERLIDEKQSIPGQGFYKTYQSGVVDQVNGWDFLNANAYIGFPISKSIGFELGHGNHFIGNGYRSLLLDDYANNYFYLKLSGNVWKFHYQSLFAELAPVSAVFDRGDDLLSKKYMASHFLNYKPHQNFEIGIFETVIFSRADHFEFQYLNPVILYRTVEQFIDSPDNVLIGLNGSWNLFNHISLYGQLVFDEFKLKEIKAGDGWFANKYGIQAGIKYIDALGIDHLDLQAEFNAVRPFTYSHRDTLVGFQNISVANYSHHSLPLAHPLGSNFVETIFKLNYKVFNKVNLESKLLYAIKGENDGDENYGADLLIPIENRTRNYGFGLTDGIKNSISTFALNLGYELAHNCHAELNFLYRKIESDNDDWDLKTQYIGVGLRYNVANLKLDY